MKEEQSYTKIHMAGIASIIGVSCLTIFTVKFAICNASDKANASYLDKLNNTTQVSSVSDSSSDVDSSDTEINIIVDESEADSSVTDSVPDDSSEIIPEVEEEPEETPDESSSVEVPEEPEETEVPEGTEEAPIVIDDSSEESDDSMPDSVDESETDEDSDSHDDNSTNIVVGDSVKSIDLSNTYIDVAGNLVYIIQRNDNLTMLSARFDTTVSAFVKANNISNADLIYTRHELIVPASDELLAYAKSKLS